MAPREAFDHPGLYLDRRRLSDHSIDLGFDIIVAENASVGDLSIWDKSVSGH